MMFANRNDQLRKDYNIGKKPAEGIVYKNQGRYSVPMPAFGEAICKIRDKDHDRYSDVLIEIDRLIQYGFLEIRYIMNPSETFSIAKRISYEASDDRDQISPMDAFIVATATTDPDCKSFCTTDSRLVSDSNVIETISEWREGHGYPEMNIMGVENILK